MKRNILLSSLAGLALGGIAVKTAQIIILKKIEREHEAVIADATDEK
jgi:hypothetical protein